MAKAALVPKRACAPLRTQIWGTPWQIPHHYSLPFHVHDTFL